MEVEAGVPTALSRWGGFSEALVFEVSITLDEQGAGALSASLRESLCQPGIILA